MYKGKFFHPLIFRPSSITKEKQDKNNTETLNDINQQHDPFGHVTKRENFLDHHH